MRSEPLGDWTTRSLGSIAKRVRRKVDGVPDNVLMITSTGGFIPQADKYSRFMAGESLKNYTALRRGEFAYNKGNSKTYPQGCIFRLDDWQVAAIPNVYISFRLTGGAVDSDFAEQFFRSGGLNRQLKRVITSGARSNGLLNVSVDDFFACEVPLPPLPEQKKIAAILSSVDEAIQATQAVIEQTRRVKEGLLQDLLTRGIGQDGRPHTRFKQTEIGEIPESWEIMTLDGLVAKPICYGVLKPGPHVPGGIPVVRIQDYPNGSLNPAEVQCSAPDIVAPFHRSTLAGGDILLSIRGTAGRLTLVPEALAGGNVSRDSARISLKLQDAVPYVFMYLQSGLAQDFVMGEMRGLAVRGINIGDLRRLPVPWPAKTERLAIRTRFASVQAYLDSGVVELKRLRQVKVGLLQDLLTGKVRVTP